ncbi:hypothetical protein SLEP1_g28372 [Rubroshorea leprosula]|uniref:RRM domain-containing protein n=1 Tax=Rubroshorea leprosula TaxID=152421 RepID=A0AAV5K5T3_9ROSI|nr:hypothetical protein SLEP1_g28372 [Rubroshorea leprosula]
MDASSSFSITQEELNLFHQIDRRLYTILVMNLWRDPVESIQVMALWLWLERVGFYDVVHRMLALPYALVNELADEAVTCLNIISNNNDQHAASSSSEANEIPLTQNFMRKDISIPFFHEHRLLATQGISRVMNEVCIRALSDIMQEAVRRNAAQKTADSQTMMPNPLQQSVFLPQLVVGQHEIWGSPEPRMVPPGVPPEDRTMFVTFSKGYPVTESEVREFFTRSHGDCIESFHMQEVHQPQDQALFAKIVFKSAASIDKILNGMSKVKFAINGKHVWARKFVPKSPRPNLPTPTPMPMQVPIQFGTQFPFGF